MKTLALPAWTTLVENDPALAAVPADLRAAAICRGLDEGAIVFRRGTPPQAMLYVLDGEVRLVRHTADGRPVVLQRSRSGFVAEASLEAAAYHCDVVAAAAGRLLLFPLAAFRRALEEDAAFRGGWMARLAGEVRRLRAQNERLHLGRAADRILHYIEAEGSDGVLVMAQSRKAWAAELGLSHEALYRTLARMVAAGRLCIDGATVTLLPAQTPARISRSRRTPT